MYFYIQYLITLENGHHFIVAKDVKYPAASVVSHFTNEGMVMVNNFFLKSIFVNFVSIVNHYAYLD